MINGVHAIIYSKKADRIRAFFKDVLNLRSADAGGGWLIFALPPAEVAVHPAGSGSHELFLMCDDIKSTVNDLKKKGVKFVGKVADQGWGILATIKLPDGTKLGLYEPRHASPLKRRRARNGRA